MNGYSAGTTILLCDPCWQGGTDLLPECQDYCNLDLSHDGVCAIRPGRQYGGEECQWRGQVDRLTDEDRENIEWDKMPTVGQRSEGQWWLNFTDSTTQGPFPSPAAAWEHWHAEVERI